MKLKEAYERQMKSLLGSAGFFAYVTALDQPYERGLRMNTRLVGMNMPCSAIPFCEEPILWARDAYFVRKGTRPGLSPLHEAGLFYLQEPSAMVPVSVLDPKPGERILDLCAAPGGKSTQIADLMEGRGVLVANEFVPARAEILSRNIERMGVPNAVVISADTVTLSAHFPDYFDRVLVDAPCSGEGLFRRQPEAIEEWNENTPAYCAARQSRILTEAAKMLRPGGVLVYSTCTFNRIENEEVVEAFLLLHPEYTLEAFALPGLPAAPTGMLHLYPHEIRGEGHFIARLRRIGDWHPEDRPHVLWKLSEDPLPEVFSGSIPPGIRREGDRLFIPPLEPEDARLRGLRVFRRGLAIGTIRGKRAEPDHALAMAMRKKEAARSFELTEEQACLFQAGEILTLGDLPSGYTLLCLAGKSLGWGKQANGIMKNHYPKGLRRR